MAVGLLASAPLPAARMGATGAVLVAALSVLVPVVAFVTTPGATTEPRSTLRLMTSAAR